jgi:hypothetical protein
MQNFPKVSPNSSTLLFEKTANYFDSVKAPMRVEALLPDAKIIVILNDPVRRAYSWYQVGCYKLGCYKLTRKIYARHNSSPY